MNKSSEYYTRAVRAAESNVYRQSDKLQNILKDPEKYNIFFVFVHGELIPSVKPGHTNYSFITPPNTIVIQTGNESGTIRTFGTKCTVDYDKKLIPKFSKNLTRTFDKFLGMRGDIADPILDPLIFNTPGEETLNKYLSLYDEVTENYQHWGIFKLEPSRSFVTSSLLGNSAENLIEITEATKYVRDSTARGLKITQFDIIQYLNIYFKKKLNIIIFINCIVAPASSNIRDFEKSYELASRRTHFSVYNDPTRKYNISTFSPKSAVHLSFEPPANTTASNSRKSRLIRRRKSALLSGPFLKPVPGNFHNKENLNRLGEYKNLNNITGLKKNETNTNNKNNTVKCAGISCIRKKNPIAKFFGLGRRNVRNTTRKFRPLKN